MTRGDKVRLAKVRSGYMHGCENPFAPQSGLRIPEGNRGGPFDEVTLSKNRRVL